jgi:hypothetical protein
LHGFHLVNMVKADSPVKEGRPPRLHWRHSGRQRCRRAPGTFPGRRQAREARLHDQGTSVAFAGFTEVRRLRPGTGTLGPEPGRRQSAPACRRSICATTRLSVVLHHGMMLCGWITTSIWRCHAERSTWPR